MIIYENCYFCNTKLFDSGQYHYCARCIDEEGAFRFFYTRNKNSLFISNINGNLLITLSKFRWMIECNSHILQSGKEIITVEEAITIMNRYEKIRAFM